MLESCLCSSEQTLFYQIIYSVIIGIIFSCFTCSLAVLFFFSVLAEALTYSLSRRRYLVHLRVGIIFGYVFGWLLGRTVFEQEFCLVSWDFDQKYLRRVKP